MSTNPLLMMNTATGSPQLSPALANQRPPSLTNHHAGSLTNPSTTAKPQGTHIITNVNGQYYCVIDDLVFYINPLSVHLLTLCILIVYKNPSVVY